MSLSMKSFRGAVSEHPVKSTLVMLMLAIDLTGTLILINSDLHNNVIGIPLHIAAFFLFSRAWIFAMKTNQYSTALYYTVMWFLFWRITNFSLDSLTPKPSTSPYMNTGMMS